MTLYRTRLHGWHSDRPLTPGRCPNALAGCSKKKWVLYPSPSKEPNLVIRDNDDASKVSN